MTVASEQSRVILNGNGATTAFPFTFRIFATTDIEVVKTDADGNESTLSEGSGSINYSVTINGEAGGTVTYPAAGGTALASGEKLTITRRIPMLQSFDFTNQGSFLSENHEDAFDKLTMMVLELKEAFDRSLKIPVSDESGTSTTLDSADIVTLASNISDIETVASQAAAGVKRNSYTGDGSTVTFALPSAPWTADVVFAYLDGVNQDNANWSVSGSNITFDTAPGSGVNIELVVLTVGTADAAAASATAAAASETNAAASEAIAVASAASAAAAANEIGLVDTLAELQALTGGVNEAVQMKGRATAGDGGGGLFRWVSGDQSSSVSADEVTASQGDGGVWIAPAADKTGASGSWNRIFNGAYDVKWYGAVGDGTTNDTSNIQRAIDAANLAGGGVVRVPKGIYKTLDNIIIKSNVFLVGDGYASHVRNEALSGFAKCTLITGNLGDPGNANSLFDETGYDIDTVAAGDKSVTLITASQDTNFAVGDIVAIASFETWSAPAGTHEKYLNLNEVETVSSGVITLRYALPDSLASTGGARPTIRAISGNINGYDGDPLFANKNCGALNLRVTQSTGLSSGWYAIFACGVNQHYENIWMDDASTLVGSNGLAHSTFRNIQGRFEAGFLDFAEWQNNLLVENIHGTRFAANSSLNRIGLSNNNGADNIFRNITCTLDGWGRFSLTKIFRGRFERCYIIDSGSASDSSSTEAILLGYGDDCEAINCHVLSQHKNGVQIVGERHRVSGCRIPATNATYQSVYATAGVDVLYVHDNEFGTEGGYTSRDRFQQQTAQSANAHIYNNTGYIEHEARKGRMCWAGYAQTSGTSVTTLKSANIKGTTSVIRGFRVTAAGARSGTASTKTVTLKLGSTSLAQVNYGASDTGAWRIESTLNVRTSTDAVHASSVAYNGTTVDAQSLSLIATGMQSDTTISVEAQCANAADAVAIYQFIVEPITEQLD